MNNNQNFPGPNWDLGNGHSTLVYCGEFYVKPSSVGRYFDLEEWYWIGGTNQGVVYRYTLLSPVFGDRYSARNWIYRRLRECCLRGIPSEAFYLDPEYRSVCTVLHTNLEPRLAQAALGRSPGVPS